LSYITTPKEPKNNLIYAYDVNSLYPSVLKDKLYPIGNPTYFEGNLLKYEPDLFGFFYCNITTPVNLNHPILQLHHKTNDGIRTLSPLGSFSGWFFSEELYNAKKYGYKFEVLRGYTFESGFIFQKYIDNLYQIRLNYPKTDPMNLLAKLLLNSLIGRFALDDSFTFTYIMNKKDYINWVKMEGVIESIIDLIEIGNSYIIQVKNPIVKLKTDLDSGTETHNVNIAIASAVTAYARIYMSQFKNNKDFPNLYYTDTDSAYFDGDGPLPDSMVDPKRLGALKLEGIYNRALFLSPKVYIPSDKIIIKIIL